MWKMYSSAVQMTMVSSYLVNPFSRWRDCFETDLPRQESEMEKEKRKDIIFICSILLNHSIFLCLVLCGSCGTRTTWP